MATTREPTCDDCYFRQEALCALRLERPCPTFRASVSGRLVPRKQTDLAPLPARRERPVAIA